MSDTIIDPKQEAMEKAAADAKARNEAIEKRANELRSNVGKWFKPIKPNPRFASQVYQVKSYDGVKRTMDGDFHIYTVESFNPRISWTPPASAFLDTVEPIDSPK